MPTPSRSPRLPAGCPDPTVDLDAFLSWHRNGPAAGMTMTGPDQPPAPPAPPAAPAPPPPAPDDRRFSQDDMTRTAAAEKDQGRRAGRREVLEPIAKALGVDNVDDLDPAQLANLAAAAQTAQRERETEAERKAREADERAAAETRRADAAEARLLDARRDAALTSAGIVLPADPAERIAALQQARGLLSVSPDADDAAVLAAVESLRGRFPGLFSAHGTPPAPGTPPPPPGQPTGTPPRQQASGDAFSKGAERAKALSS